MDFDFSQTYLYKLHAMTSLMDRVFDQTLLQHADISLSQFTLLLAVAHYDNASSRAIATFLEQSPAAISRQVERARTSNWLTVTTNPDNRRGHTLSLTPTGKQKIQDGMSALQTHLFQIFDDANVQTNLMEHIDLLIGNMRGLKK